MKRALGITLLLGALAGGCGGSGTRYALLGTRAHPTTDGEARIEESETGGYDVSVVLDHLPPLSALGDGLTAYVLWLTPEGVTPPVRAGVLTVDPTTRRGRARANTSAQHVEVRITAEEVADVDVPSGSVIVQSVLVAP